MERFVLPVWDLAVSIVRRKSEASSEALEAPSIMRMLLGEEVHVLQNFIILGIISSADCFKEFVLDHS